MQLWTGCITEDAAALQLLLIVDYIADWARDIYRPSILKHLKSTISQDACNQASISNDSEVYSMTSANPSRQISNMVPAPPTPIDANEMQGDTLSNPGSESPKNIPPVSVFNLERGSLQSASYFKSKLFGLRLTEDNVQHLLGFSKGVYGDSEECEKLADRILNLLLGPDDCIAMQETDLDFFENSWAFDMGTLMEAKARASTSPNPTIFYVVADFSTFMTNTWDIKKEISYIAVSKPALDALTSVGRYAMSDMRSDRIVQRAGLCSHMVLRDTIECLRLGSPWQNFCDATSCKRVSLCYLPARTGDNYNTPAPKAVGFVRTSQLWMRQIIEQCHKYSQKQPLPKNLRHPIGSVQALKDIDPEPQQLTFIRDLEIMEVTSMKKEHDSQICGRCCYVSGRFKKDHRFSITNAPAMPKSRMVLVEALDLITESGTTRHDLCMMAFDIIPKVVADSSTLAAVVYGLLKANRIFHTIRHPLPPRYAGCPRDTIWNLPLPYRQGTKPQREDMWNLCLELQGRPIPKLNTREDTMNYWDNLQLLLYFLKLRLTYKDSCAKVNDFAQQSCSRKSFIAKHRETLRSRRIT